MKRKLNFFVALVCFCFILSACGNSGSASNPNTPSNSSAEGTGGAISAANPVSVPNEDSIEAKVNETISKPFLSLQLGDSGKYGTFSINGISSKTNELAITDTFTKDLFVGDIEKFILSSSSIPKQVLKYMEDNGGYDVEVIYNNCEPFYEDITCFTTRYDVIDPQIYDNMIYFPNVGKATVTIKYSFEDVEHEIILNVNVSNPIDEDNPNDFLNSPMVKTDKNTVVFVGGSNSENVYYINESNLINGRKPSILRNVKDHSDSGNSVAYLNGKIYYCDGNAIKVVAETDGGLSSPEVFLSADDYNNKFENIFCVGNRIYTFIRDSGSNKNYGYFYLLDESGEILNRSAQFKSVNGICYYNGNIYISGTILDARNKDQSELRIYRMDSNLFKAKASNDDIGLKLPYIQSRYFNITDEYTYFATDNGLYQYKNGSGDEPVLISQETHDADIGWSTTYNPPCKNFIIIGKDMYCLSGSNGYAFYEFFKINLDSGEVVRLRNSKNDKLINISSFAGAGDVNYYMNKFGDYIYLIPKGRVGELDVHSIYAYSILTGELNIVYKD